MADAMTVLVWHTESDAWMMCTSTSVICEGSCPYANLWLHAQYFVMTNAVSFHHLVEMILHCTAD